MMRRERVAERVAKRPRTARTGKETSMPRERGKYSNAESLGGMSTAFPEAAADLSEKRKPLEKGALRLTQLCVAR